MKLEIPFLLALVLFSACQSNPNNTQSNSSSVNELKQVTVFDRLTGLWKNTDGTSYERWTNNPDGSYLSVGFRVKGADTVYTEQVYVYAKNGQWISENTVLEQNNGRAITFTITQLTKDVVHFNNPNHDFPTDIFYRLTNENAINAYISGPNQSGSRDTIPFNFSRVMD